METSMEIALFITFTLTTTLNYLRGVESATFTLKNNCPYTVWPATQSGAGSPILSSTGFELPNGASFSLYVPAHWSGRFWARSHCHFNQAGNFGCATGDCNSGTISCNGAGGTPPVTLAEFTLSGYMNRDFYDISLVDGFNIPLSIVPQGGRECPTTSCPANLNANCPQELAFKNPNGRYSYETIGCMSACMVFNEPQYCCTGDYGSPQTCPPTYQSQYFKRQCPQAYSYAFDDGTSTFTCPTGVNYFITFCPTLL